MPPRIWIHIYIYYTLYTQADAERREEANFNAKRTRCHRARGRPPGTRRRHRRCLLFAFKLDTTLVTASCTLVITNVINIIIVVVCGVVVAVTRARAHAVIRRRALRDIYFFHVLQRGRRHVRVSPEFGRPRRCQAGPQRPVAGARAPGVASDLHVRVPPLQRVRDGHVQQAIGRVLRQHRLQYWRALLFAPANAAAPRVLRRDHMETNNIKNNK